MDVQLRVAVAAVVLEELRDDELVSLVTVDGPVGGLGPGRPSSPREAWISV